MFHKVKEVKHQERHGIVPANRGRIPTVVRFRERFSPERCGLTLCSQKKSVALYGVIAF